MFANAKNLHFDAHQLLERDTLSHATSIIATNKTTLGGTTTGCSTEDKGNQRQLISDTDCTSCRTPDVSNFLFIIIRKDSWNFKTASCGFVKSLRSSSSNLLLCLPTRTSLCQWQQNTTPTKFFFFHQQLPPP
jgi:hypothetical protein